MRDLQRLWGGISFVRFVESEGIRTSIFEGRQIVPGRGHRLGGYWRMFDYDSYL